MTAEDLLRRVEALEAEVRQLKAPSAAHAGDRLPGFGRIGRFADDPTFDEAVRLGREYRDRVNRESLEEYDRENAPVAPVLPPKPIKARKSKRRKADVRS